MTCSNCRDEYLNQLRRDLEAMALMAYQHEEISIGRLAELLACSIEDAQERASRVQDQAPRVEPRRPQVTDYVEVLRDTHWRLLFVNSATTSQPGADLPEFFTATDMYSTTEQLYVADEGTAWRWPATQGAAVAGPARECPLPCVLPPGHEGSHRLAPPPPTSEPHAHAERDALAAQLKAVREALEAAALAAHSRDDYHEGSFDSCDHNRCHHARAALAASGPAKEGE
jgi:hypothetical protein